MILVSTYHIICCNQRNSREQERIVAVCPDLFALHLKLLWSWLADTKIRSHVNCSLKWCHELLRHSFPCFYIRNYYKLLGGYIQVCFVWPHSNPRFIPCTQKTAWVHSNEKVRWDCYCSDSMASVRILPLYCSSNLLHKYDTTNCKTRIFVLFVLLFHQSNENSDAPFLRICSHHHID